MKNNQIILRENNKNKIITIISVHLLYVWKPIHQNLVEVPFDFITPLTLFGEERFSVCQILTWQEFTNHACKKKSRYMSFEDWTTSALYWKLSECYLFILNIATYIIMNVSVFHRIFMLIFFTEGGKSSDVIYLGFIFTATCNFNRVL